MPEMIGLDIGSHSVKLVGLKTASKGSFITHLGIREIPPGHDEDRVGYLTGILRDLLKEAGIKSGKVRMTVSGSGVNIKRISIPDMPRAELKEAVRWEIKGHLPFPVETAQIDFHILGEVIEDKIKKLDLMVVSCPNHLIDQSFSIAREAGLEPIHLDVAPFALWDAYLTWGRPKEGEEVALIDLGADKTGIHLFKGKTLQFSREVTPAGADITRAIIDGIGSREEPNIFYEKAERIKESLGVFTEGTQQKIPGETINVPKVVFHMRPILERMAAEIGRSLDYYKHEFNVDKIDRVLLTGGGAHLKNILAYLGNALRLPVEQFNPLKEMLFDSKKIDAQIIEQMGSLFTVAAGLTLPQPKRIELLPVKEPFLSKARFVKFIPILAPLLTLIVFLLIIWNVSGKVAALKKERDEKVGKVMNIETLQAKLTLLKEKEEKAKGELSLFPSSVTIPLPYVEILKEIVHINPENVTLKLLSAQAKEKKETQTSTSKEKEFQEDQGMELHITGVTFGSDMQCLTALAQIIEGLEKSPFFKNARLMSAEENKLYNRPGADFEMACDMVAEDNQKKGDSGD
jgi:type IV pilus assembly protein PilM